MNRIKFPRTMHLPWSPGMTTDDKRIKNLDAFEGKRVIATLKKDGENTTLYSDYMHARSIDGRDHPSRSWAKQFHASIADQIPRDWRVCCENMYAKHSIAYDNLPSYLYGLSIWDANNLRMGWEDSVIWFQMLGIPQPEVIYDGIWDEAKIEALAKTLDFDKEEGYVVTVADPITYDQYQTHVAKYVRAKHVATDAVHWQTAKVIPNKLKA